MRPALSTFWRAHRLPLALLLAIAGAILVAYFANSPQAEVEFDSQNTFGTPTYLGAARDMLHGHLFSAGRLPAYPLLLVVLGATQGFYWLVLAVQALMFLVTVSFTYAVAWRVFQQRWVAFLVGLMIATDVYAAAYAKEILSESLALTLVAALMASIASFVQRPQRSTPWIIAALATVTTFTRPEWIFLPLALGAYFALLAWRRPVTKLVAVHGIAALVACYAVVGIYIAGNAVFNGYAGTSEINNIGLLGKAMQYDMQLEAPAQYHDPAVIVDQYVHVLQLNVWHVVIENPSFSANHYELSGSLGRAAILADPLKYINLSTELVLTRNADVDLPLLHVVSGGPFRLELAGLARYTVGRYAFYWLLPAFALWWAVFPLLSRRKHALDSLGPIAVLALYGTVIIGFAGFDEYGRYHTVFLPATNIVVWGTLLLNVVAARKPLLGLWSASLVTAEIAWVILLATVPSIQLALAVTAATLLLQGALFWFAFGRADPTARSATT
jgi:hypothetical protein